MCVFLLNIISILALYTIFIFNKTNTKQNFSPILESLQIVLRGQLAKGSKTDHNQWMSFKTALFFILIGELFIFIAYRCAMNAFLSVKLTKLPINSLQDIIDKGFGLTFVAGGSTEHLFLNSPKDSILVKHIT